MSQRRDVLGMGRVIDWQTAVLAMAYSLIEFGVVDKTAAYRGVSSSCP